MSHYQVLFSGEVAEGAQEATVRDNLSRELGIDERKIGQLFSGRTVVIRSQLSQEDALAIQARFADLGAALAHRDGHDGHDADAADLVLRNGRVVTLEEGIPEGEAIAIRN